jgi:hypothetical protein
MRRLAPRLSVRFVSARAGQPLLELRRGLGLTSNQMWGFARTDEEWSIAMEAALTATRRDDIEHGTTGCVCKECRDHQRDRMARQRRG